jgi:hypothetical protein
MRIALFGASGIIIGRGILREAFGNDGRPLKP